MKKWAVWKTIVVIFSAIVLIAGATVGGILLSKGTGGEIVMPNDISFVLDQKLYNSTTSQFEVTDDFKLTITSDTANVTETQVRLSFDGTTSRPSADGTISDGTIIVPEYVYINQPFDVKLRRSVLLDENGQPMLDNNGASITTVNGGISSLRARSANIQKLPKLVKIAVDVPVQRIDVEIVDALGNVVTKVTEGDEFYAKAKFFPEASRYLYSDDKNDLITTKREKQAYFEPAGSTEVNFHYDDEKGGYFVAGSAREDNQILGYTFKSANKQIEIINQYSQTATGVELYNTVLSYLSSSTQDSVSNKENPAKVDIEVATITGFNVLKAGKSLKDANSFARYTLTVREDAYTSDFLDARINGNGGADLVSMLKNVAIKIEYQVQDKYLPITTDILSVRGGKVVEINGSTYYLPNATVSNPKWELYTTGVYSFRLTVVLLENNSEAESGYSIYSEDNIEISSIVYLDSKTHPEKDVTWSDDSDITMTLDFDGEDVIPATKALEGLGQIPSENIFGTGVYFAYFTNSNVEDVLDKNSYDIERSGEYTIGTQTYYLYALKGSELAVKGTGSFELYFASVQTNEFGQFNYDASGKYIIVQATLNGIDVNVTKTLYEGSVASLNVETDNTTGFIYEGSDEKILLNFSIKADSWEVFKEQLASEQIHLTIFDLAGEDITDKFSFDYTYNEAEKMVVYTLSVNSSLNLTSDIVIGDVKLEDDFSKNTWTFTSNADIKIYSPYVQSIDFTSDSVDLSREVTVNQQITSDSTFKTIISHYLPDGNVTTIDSENAVDIFINKLSVKVTDQHGNTNIFSSKWSYATNNSNVITVNNKTFFFKTADNASADIYVQCEGKNSTAVSFKVTSTGIQSIKKDGSTNIKTPTNDDYVNNNDTASVSIEKFAASGRTITLKNLVKLYTDEKATNELNSGYKFIFNSAYLYSLNDETLLNIFGSNGMVYLNRSTNAESDRGILNELSSSFTANELRTFLAQIGSETGNESVRGGITNIYIRNDFATYHELGLQIVSSNNSGAINISLDVLLQTNVTAEIDSEIETYAGFKQEAKGKLIYKDGNATLEERLGQYNGYYIVRGGDGYVLSNADDAESISVGRIVEGKFLFNDFFDTESNNYSLTIYLDLIENPFALTYNVKFTVKRNVKIEYNGKTYSILTNADSLTNYFAISRIKEGSDELTFDLKVLLSSAENSNLRLSGNGLDSVIRINEANPIFFDYNTQKLSEELIFSLAIAGSDNYDEVARLKFDFDLGERYSYSKLANQIYFKTDADNILSNIQTVDNVNYLLVQQNSNWKYSGSIPDSAYNFEVRKYYVNANGERITQYAYDLPGQNSISFININESIRGLNDNTCYLIAEIYNGANRKQATLLIPLLVSNIGMDFVNYTSADWNNLSNALATPDDLINNGIYEEVWAGSVYEIAHQMSFEDTNVKDENGILEKSKLKGFIFPEGTGITTSVSFVPTSVGYHGNLVNNIYQNEESKTWYVDINHLSTAIDTAYIALRLQISNGAYVQNFYYILKVNSDTKVNNALYAFDSGREEIAGVVDNVIGGENGINLSEKYSNNTLHVGEERFSVVVKDSEGNITETGDNLKFSYEVVSITINNQTYTNKEQYAPYISIEFREVNGHINMLVTPYDTATMTLIIKRVYDGGKNSATRQVIGGEIEYKFVINSTINYSLSYVGDDVLQENNNAVIEMDSSKTNLEMDVKLISTVNSTSSVVYGRLQINGYSEDGKVITNITDITPSTEEESILIASYDPATARLTLQRGDYLEKDKTAFITFYTDYGYLGELKVNLKASAEIDLTTDVIAGSTYAFKDLVKTLKLNGNEVLKENFSIDSANLIGQQEDDRLFEFVGDTGKFKIYSSIKDANLDILVDLTITALNEEGIQTSYKYSFEMQLKISANIKQTNGVSYVGTDDATAERKEYSTPVIAQNNLVLVTENFMSFGKTDEQIETVAPENFDILYSWEAISGSDFVNQASKQTSPIVETKDVNVNGATVVLLFTIHLQRENVIYQEFYVRYTFTINPNTKITVSYPDPENVVQTYKYFEYIKDGLTYYLNFEDCTEDNSGSSVQYRFNSGCNYYSEKTLNNVAGQLATGYSTLEVYKTYKPSTHNEKFNSEYLKNGTSFDSAKDNFLAGSVTFGGQRLVITNVEGSNVGTNYKATLSKKGNMTITSSLGDIDLEDGKNVIVDTTKASTIDAKNLTFIIGNKNESGEIVNDGTESFAEFIIESNGVTDIFRVVLQDNVLSLVINQENSEGSNNLETFYVDNILSNNILDDSRLIEYSINSRNQNSNIDDIINDNYRLIFVKTENENTYYKYRDVQMSANDIGKTLYYDIGEKVEGYVYYGTYHNNEDSFVVDANGQLIMISDKAVKVDDEKLYATIPTLASRVKLTYAGTRVNYDYVNNGLSFASDYKDSANIRFSDLSNYTTQQNAQEIREVVKLNGFEFVFDNGASTITTKFSTNYNYTTDLDIAVEFSGLENVSQVYVNQEITSIINNNKIYHPSNKQYLTNDEIKTRQIDINLQIVGIDKAIDSEILQKYEEKYEGISKPYYNDTDHRYLAISAFQEKPNGEQSNNRVLDYRITGFGANNGGSHVLLYFTYQVARDGQTYIKDFYLVYKVVPDYKVSYLNTTALDEDENGIISNQSTPYALYVGEATNQYNFNIAGASNGLNIVSVMHTMSDTPNKEMAANGFKYSLKLDENINGYSYNISENVDAKLNTNLTATDSLWTSDSKENPKEWYWENANDDAVLGFKNVNKVIFGSQNYRLKAIDNYGYIFYVYFVLQSEGELPTALEEGTFTLTENYGFDIAAVYEGLDILVDEKLKPDESGRIPIDIVPPAVGETNSNGENFRVLNIANLEAWGFKEELFSSSETEEGGGASELLIGDKYLSANAFSGGYSLKNSKFLEEDDDKYLAVPNFAYTTVTHISWYYDNDLVAEITPDPTVEKTYLATRSSLIFNGVNHRQAEKNFTMPRLAGYIYGISDSVELTMVITLTYSKNDNVEVFELPVRMTVNRDYSSTQNINNAVRDGQEFAISDYITASSITGSELGKTDYLDDTLKVTLPGDRRVVYTLEKLDSNGEVIKSVTNRITSNEAYNYTRTEYVSLSQILNETLHEGDKLRLTVTDSGNTEIQNTEYTGYYIDYAGNVIYGENNGVADEKNGVLDITISKIVNDRINIPMAEQLYDGPSVVTKYYLARTSKYDIDSDTYIPEDKYTYRIRQSYNVTNYYYSMSTNRTSDYQVDKYLIVKDAFGKGQHQYIIPRLGWTNSMTLNIAENKLEGMVSKPEDSFNDNTNGYIYYEITDASSSGAANIDENGQITTSEAFNVDTHYINVAIYVKASGLDGKFSNKNELDKRLGSVRFLLKAPVIDDSGEIKEVNGNKVMKLDNKVNSAIVLDAIGYSKGKQGLHSGETITLPETKEVYATMSKAVVGIGEEVEFNSGLFIGYKGLKFKTAEDNLKYQVAFDNTTKLYTYDINSGIFTDSNKTIAEIFGDSEYRIDKELFDREVVNSETEGAEAPLDYYKVIGEFDGSSMTGYRVVAGDGTVYYVNIEDVAKTYGVAIRKTELQFINKGQESDYYILHDGVKNETGLCFYHIGGANNLDIYVPVGDYGVSFIKRVAS